MISRTIIPLVSQEDILPNSGSQSGFGDVLQSLFFSPKSLAQSGWTWGVGPALLLRTASDDLLGPDQWSAGPAGATAVALKQTTGGWTYGALVNHLWSFAGDDDRADLSSTFLQPFLVSYQVGARYYFEAPDNGAQWGLRFTFTLLFPK